MEKRFYTVLFINGEVWQGYSPDVFSAASEAMRILNMFARDISTVSDGNMDYDAENQAMFYTDIMR